MFNEIDASDEEKPLKKPTHQLHQSLSVIIVTETPKQIHRQDSEQGEHPKSNSAQVARCELALL